MNWICLKCGKEVEASMDICWQCGTSRDGVEDRSFPADYAVTETADGNFSFRIGDLIRLVAWVGVWIWLARFAVYQPHRFEFVFFLCFLLGPLLFVGLLFFLSPDTRKPPCP